MSSPSSSDTNQTPWDQTVDFLEATDTVVRPGGPTAYVEPRPVGSTPTDVTGFVPGQAAWTSNDWPNILYTLHPPPGWEDFRQSPAPPLKRDTEGNLIYESHPLPAEPGKRARKAKPLRDFTILPDIIGTRNPWWYYEAIRRIDPRVCWSDILMRMPLEGRRRQNALNMESSRMRLRYQMISWHPTSDESRENEIRHKVMRNLTRQQIAANTTRGSTPGLINPLQGEASGRVAHLALRNGQGQVRGSRPPRPKNTKKTKDLPRPDKHIKDGHVDKNAGEQNEVDEEPRFKAFPRARTPTYASYSTTKYQYTRQAMIANGGRVHIQPRNSRARSPRDARLPPFDHFPNEVRVTEEHGPRKRKRDVDATAHTDDEEIGATIEDLSRRRVAARFTSRPTPNTTFTPPGSSHMRRGPVDWSIMNQGMRRARPPGQALSEEVESIRRPNNTPLRASQLDGQINGDAPPRHDQSLRKRRVNFTNRPGGHDSLYMSGRRYLPIGGNQSRPLSQEYDQHAPTHRRAANNTHFTNHDGAIPAPSYNDNFSAFQAQQERVTSRPIHTAPSSFHFDVVRGGLNTRHTGPPLLSTEESRILCSGEEDVVWGNRNSTIPRYTDGEVFGSGLPGTNHLRPSRRTQPYVDSIPRLTITANRPRVQNQRPALAPLNNPFFGYNDNDMAAYGESDTQ